MDPLSGLLHESLSELQEGSFQVDFFFAEQGECEVCGDKFCGEAAVVFDVGFQCGFDELVFCDGDFFNAVELFQQSCGGIGPLFDSNVQQDSLPCFAHDFGDVAIDDHMAFLDHTDSGTDVCQFREDVAADDDGFSHLPQSSEEISDLNAGSRVQSAGGFIQQQHLWIVEQCACESDALSLSARQFVDHGISFEGHVDKFEFFFDDFASSFGHDAVSGGEEFEVFDDGHIIVHAEEVGHETDESADFFLVGVDGFSADVGFAVIGCQQCGDHPHGGGFA